MCTLYLALHIIFVAFFLSLVSLLSVQNWKWLSVNELYIDFKAENVSTYWDTLVVFVFVEYGLQDHIRNIRICPKVAINILVIFTSRLPFFKHFILTCIIPADIYIFRHMFFWLQEIYAGKANGLVCEILPLLVHKCKIRIRKSKFIKFKKHFISEKCEWKINKMQFKWKCLMKHRCFSILNHVGLLWHTNV